ncbi:hypothetical protein SKAU_G00204500 [Synaphobranchus kaupii]|uniref:Uncharacterized protein n=1 Tax=Synaphobranchus kaupii TaxID=118154 RepID=A0A9Q1IY59_SYNKA|nr:hypothetical protein SKAU_G00204500 [Synaphobranchus kaupii]
MERLSASSSPVLTSRHGVQLAVRLVRHSLPQPNPPAATPQSTPPDKRLRSRVREYVSRAASSLIVLAVLDRRLLGIRRENELPMAFNNALARASIAGPQCEKEGPVFWSHAFFFCFLSFVTPVALPDWHAARNADDETSGVHNNPPLPLPPRPRSASSR